MPLSHPQPPREGVTMRQPLYCQGGKRPRECGRGSIHWKPRGLEGRVVGKSGRVRRAAQCPSHPGVVGEWGTQESQGRSLTLMRSKSPGARRGGRGEEKRGGLTLCTHRGDTRADSARSPRRCCRGRLREDLKGPLTRPAARPATSPTALSVAAEGQPGAVSQRWHRGGWGRCAPGAGPRRGVSGKGERPGLRG